MRYIGELRALEQELVEAVGELRGGECGALATDGSTASAFAIKLVVNDAAIGQSLSYPRRAKDTSCWGRGLRVVEQFIDRTSSDLSDPYYLRALEERLERCRVVLEDAGSTGRIRQEVSERL